MSATTALARKAGADNAQVITTGAALARGSTNIPELTPEEQALLNNDLSQLTPEQRANLVMSVCNSLGLNPLTQPFQYVTLNGKLTLYARKDATDQLRSLHDISIKIASREDRDGVYMVTAEATTPSGRFDESLGALSIKGLLGEALCNALMKAETKAKRRVTLSICGLGFLDETEVESVQEAEHAEISYDRGPTRRETLNNALSARRRPAASAQATVVTEDPPIEDAPDFTKMTPEQVGASIADAAQEARMTSDMLSSVVKDFGGKLTRTNAAGVYARIKQIVRDTTEAAAGKAEERSPADNLDSDRLL